LVKKNNQNLSSRIISSLAQHSGTYSIMQIFFSAYFRKSNKSFKAWLYFFMQQFKKAYKREKPVVWASIYTPSELLYAMDVIPIYPEMISASVASIGLADHFIETSESNFYMLDLCSFYRVASGMFLNDCLPQPDMIISTSHLCDGSIKFFHNASKYFHCEHYLIDPPYEDNANNEKYLENDLKRLVDWISRKTRRKIQADLVRNSMHLANQSRLTLQKINKLRKLSPVPLSGWNALSYILYMYFASFGTADSLSFYKLLLQEIEKNAKENKRKPRNREIRILWLHQLRPYYPNIILKTLTAHNAVIAFEEMSHIYWPEHDLNRPYFSLAKKMYANPGVGPLENRVSAVLKLVNRYKIDGVIHFNQRGCRQSCGGAPIIKDCLKARDIPMLILDGDGIDSRNYSEGQTKTRLEAFLEIIEKI